MAAEVYLVSSLLINKRNEIESAYLIAFAAALKLSDSLLIELEKAKQDANV